MENLYILIGREACEIYIFESFEALRSRVEERTVIFDLCGGLACIPEGKHSTTITETEYKSLLEALIKKNNG